MKCTLVITKYSRVTVIKLYKKLRFGRKEYLENIQVWNEPGEQEVEITTRLVRNKGLALDPNLQVIKCSAPNRQLLEEEKN